MSKHTICIPCKMPATAAQFSLTGAGGWGDWENLLRQEETQLLPPHPYPFPPRTSEPGLWLLIKAPECLLGRPLLGMGVGEVPTLPRGRQWLEPARHWLSVSWLQPSAC